MKKSFLVFLVLLLCFTSCASPTFDTETYEGIKALAEYKGCSVSEMDVAELTRLQTAQKEIGTVHEAAFVRGFYAQTKDSQHNNLACIEAANEDDAYTLYLSVLNRGYYAIRQDTLVVYSDRAYVNNWF